MLYKKIFIFFIAVLAGQMALSQTEPLSFVRSKLSAYQQISPEKIYVHTDREFYVAGEILWFKLYSIHDQNLHPGLYSEVAYVEILDGKNAPVARVKTALSDHAGNGSVMLPVTMNSGAYKLRAYTNRMKNFGANLFFEKDIKIINPLKTPETKQSTATGFYLNLFPEGGHLVNGLPSRVAYHLVDHAGRGTTGKGYLLNQNNDTLSIFSPVKFGMGSFQFTPSAGEKYRVVFAMPSGALAGKPLPDAFASGYVMAVEEDRDDRLKVTVTSNAREALPEVFLVVQNRQDIKMAQRGILQNGIVSFYVYKKEMGEGLIQFTVFDHARQPKSERLFFVPPVKNPIGNIATDKKTYQPRSRVSLAANDLPQTGASYSVAVYQLDSLQDQNPEDIFTYYWLTSELTGKVENPSYYFSSATDVKKATDLLMLTHGWRRFNWEFALEQTAAFRFPAEKGGHIIRTKLTHPGTGQPARGVPVFLSVPGAYYKLYSGETDSSGIAAFTVKDYFGPSEIIVQPRFPKDSIYQIQVMSPFSEDYTGWKPQEFHPDPAVKKSLLQYSIGMQSQHIYVPDSLRKFNPAVVADTFPFYGQSLYTYELDDYRRFTTMEEVLREYVREINVGVRGSGSSLRLKLFNEDNRELYTDNILVVVDGVPLMDPNRIFGFDPLKIKSLNIITKNYVLGTSVFHALASFSSYEGNYEGFELDPKSVAIDYEGLQLQREFFAPDYSDSGKKESRIPDLRTTLFWHPGGNSAKLDFFTGDNRAKYLVVLQGMAKNGDLISAQTAFDVQ